MAVMPITNISNHIERRQIFQTEVWLSALGAKKMETVSIQNKSVNTKEYGLEIDQLQLAKKPIEIDRAKKAVAHAKNSLETVNGSNAINKQDIEKLAGQLNSLSESLNVELRFSVEKKGLGAIHIKMIDAETNEIIREIPPEKLSLIGSRLIDIAGLVIDEQA